MTQKRFKNKLKLCNMVAAFSVLVLVGVICFTSISLVTGSLTEASTVPNFELDDPVDPLFSQPIIVAPPPASGTDLPDVQWPITAVPPIGYIDLSEIQEPTEQTPAPIDVTCRVYNCPTCTH